MTLGFCLKICKKTDEAIKAYEQVIILNPANTAIQNAFDELKKNKLTSKTVTPTKIPKKVVTIKITAKSTQKSITKITIETTSQSTNKAT